MSNPSDFVIEKGVLKKYTGPGGDVVIPDGVSAIGDCAFFGCENLTSVTIPEGVTSIGKSAFFRCDDLKSMTIPEGVTSIGKEAFFRCEGLESVTLPDGVEDFGKDVFSGCHCLISIPHWTEGFSRAVGGNDSLTVCTKDELPAIPAKYRPQALLGFLMKAESGADAEKSAAYREYAEKNAGKLCGFAVKHRVLLLFLCENDLIKAKDIDAYLTEAGKSEDAEIKALLLDYQNRLGAEKVSKAREKKEKVKEDYADALAERIAARDPSKGIEGMTFVITGKLSTWPKVWENRDEVKAYLESYGAFLDPSVTKKTDYLVTNDTDSGSEKNRKAQEYDAQVISEADFNEMVGKRFKNADHIAVPSWLREIPAGAFSGCSGLMSVTIPEGVKSIGNRTFAGCSGLTSLTIPQSVERIGLSAFSGCRKLTHVELPDGLKEIGDNAFDDCSALTDIAVPQSVSKIGRSAFKRCTALADSEGFVIVNGTVFDYYGPGGDISIPDRCRAIEEFALSCKFRLTGVEVPNTVTDIGGNAFSSCDNLIRVTIPESVTRISLGLFSDCGALTDVEIPDTVTSIERKAFEGCASLTGVTIPEGVTEIGSGAFMNCAKLTGVTLPAGLTRIEPETFKGCGSLTSVTIPEGVKMIGYEAFKSCGALRDVTLPGSLTEIGYDAFTNRAKIKIHAPEGSYAERYAKQNKIRFVAEG